MKKINTFHKGMIAVGFICILVGNFIAYRHKEIVYVDECSCSCHAMNYQIDHEISDEKIISKRAYGDNMSAKESIEMMKRQTEECNRPFVEFMEWLKQKKHA